MKCEGLLRLSGMAIGMSPMIMVSSLTSYPRLKDRILTLGSLLTIMYSIDTSFSSCLQHDLLPTQERLYSYTVTSYKCTLCAQNVLCDQLLASKRPGTVVHCLFNNGIGCWIIRCLRQILPNIQPVQLITLGWSQIM